MSRQMSRNEIIIANAYMLPRLVTSAMEQILGEDMAKAAYNEGHRAVLPLSPQVQVLNEAHKTVLAAINEHGPMTRASICRTTGFVDTHVTMVIQALKSRGYLIVKGLSNTHHIYGLTGQQQAEPPKLEKYPGTVVEGRLNAEPSRAINIPQHINPIRLPTQPPTQRLDAILQGIDAKAVPSRCAGENLGVL